ncbi:hypothetical protein HK097_010880 [Rhizophlyctis rosea]|uniref:Uncharacterized protein n=1 Tax=Rhizophlyctis rosea TaxID=64517 RepID=A0AAD5S9R1_9FUNG|nr:hypothetical protein HK097_010880 [Rhizophlyctis rosea]
MGLLTVIRPEAIVKIAQKGNERGVTAVIVLIPGEKVERVVVDLSVGRSTVAAVLDPKVRGREGDVMSRGMVY